MPEASFKPLVARGDGKADLRGRSHLVESWQLIEGGSSLVERLALHWWNWEFELVFGQNAWFHGSSIFDYRFFSLTSYLPHAFNETKAPV